jgi:putative tryptophan/tyrosine transport system substrate-binding protein
MGNGALAIGPKLPRPSSTLPTETSRLKLAGAIYSSLASRNVLGFGYCAVRQLPIGDSMRRRDFVTILGGAAVTRVIRPRMLRAGTSSKLPIVALAAFVPVSKVVEPYVGFLGQFPQGLQELGYVLGRDLDLQFHVADGNPDHWPAVVKEINQLKPDVVLAVATFEAVTLRKATSTIPIVCPALGNAVHLGLIASEARPGGNITGIEPYIAGLPAKQIELAREIVPGASTIGLLTNSDDPKGAPQVPELEAAGRAVGLKIVAADASRPGDIETALRELGNARADVVIVLETSLLLLNCPQIAASALAMRLPTVYGYREHVMAGGLVSYGVDLRWCYHRSAYFVDKILHGAAPGDLPIEFPVQFPLSINLKTARELGLTVSPSLLSRADEVIE